MRLFKNDVSPGVAATTASFVEATFTGYAPKNGLSFAPSFKNINGQYQSDSAVETFTFTAGTGNQTIYGWYITDQANAVVLAYTRLNIPFIIDDLHNLVIAPSIIVYAHLP